MWFTGRESKLEFAGTSAPGGYLIPQVVLSSSKFLSFEFSACAFTPRVGGNRCSRMEEGAGRLVKFVLR